MTREELLLRTRMATGQVYKILTETMERYWNKKSLLYWTKLSAELDAKKTDAYKADSLFPYEFFDAMADPLLRWHWDKFKGINDIEITPLFQRLWKYHKHYLEIPLTEDVVEQLMEVGDAIVDEQDKDAKPFVLSMILAIIKDLERRNPGEEDTANEQTTEANASQTV